MVLSMSGITDGRRSSTSDVTGGREDDGYVCSSKLMREAYKRNPEYFKRRVVQRVYTNRLDLLTEEHKWLAQIKDEELGKRYYNLSKRHFGHWSSGTDGTVQEKLKEAWRRRKERGWTTSEETRKKLSKVAIDRNARPPIRTGALSEDTKAKLSAAHTGKVLSKEHRAKLAESTTGVPRAAKLWRCTYTDGRIVETKGRGSFGIPIITVKRLAKSGMGSPKHGIVKIEKI
jgi:hypothetical protein